MSDLATVDNETVQAKLLIQSPDGQQSIRELSEGDNFTVGTSDDCEIQVAGEDVAAMHCMMGITNGRIWVRDCYSKSGTLVNGNKVTETKLSPGDEIQVGAFHLTLDGSDTLESAATLRQTTPNEPLPVSDPPECEDEPTVECSSSESEQELEPETVPSDSPAPTYNETQTAAAEKEPVVDHSEVSRLREELDQALQESVGLRDQLKKQRAQQAPPREAAAGDPFQEEMIELLRDEVSQLQAELAQRDSLLEEASQLSAYATEESASPQGETDLEKGLERLDQLIEELDHKDEQIRSLEGLLSAAEEATKAEQEERTQLESWVTDIEERMGARESEWEANLTSLRSELEERTRERDRALGDLEEAASEGHTGAEGLHERLTENLREQVASLEKRLAESQRRTEELERQSAAAPEGGSSAYVEAKVEEQIRAERVELARERAALARAQAEFEKSRRRMAGGETSEDGAPAEDWSAGLDSSQRIRALRDHLKEVHDEEQKTRQNRGLSGRLSSLWKRLENRDE